MKTVAILNPAAARGRTARRWPSIERMLLRAFPDLQGRFTERPGHAAELTRRAIEEGAELIIAVGGDGTVNETVNGFFGADGRLLRPETKLGLIPIGTGSDLQRTLQIPSEAEAAVEVLRAGVTVNIDIGKARLTGHDGAPLERYFINLLSFGMGGAVAVRAKNFFSRGRTAFFYATLAVALGYRGRSVRLTLDGEPHAAAYRIMNIAIGNGRYHGGGMHPCPRASVSDGLLDVTTIGYLNLVELIRDVRILYSDDVYRHPKARHFRARKIRADSDEATLVEVDGEALGRLPLEVEVIPKILPLIVPPGSALLEAAAEPQAARAPSG